MSVQNIMFSHRHSVLHRRGMDGYPCTNDYRRHAQICRLNRVPFGPSMPGSTLSEISISPWATCGMSREKRTRKFGKIIVESELSPNISAQTSRVPHFDRGYSCFKTCHHPRGGSRLFHLQALSQFQLPQKHNTQC